MLFFFSSRRRHTRYWRDWSSDVCSSDLLEYPGDARSWRPIAVGVGVGVAYLLVFQVTYYLTILRATTQTRLQIGRASCRGKSVDLGGRRIIKKKKYTLLTIIPLIIQSLF